MADTGATNQQELKMGEYEGKNTIPSQRHANSTPNAPVIGKSALPIEAHESQTTPGGVHRSEAAGSTFVDGKTPWSGERGEDRVAAPESLDFGDIETTESRIENVFVFNQHREPATISAMLDAPPTLQIVERPSLLRPSHEGFDPATAIRIAYSPHRTAVDDGKLVVVLRWSDGVAQTVRINIRAAAHLRSEPTHAEKASQAAGAKQEADTRAHQATIAAAHELKVQEAIDRPGGIQPRIDLAYHTLRNSADHFFSNQAAGVSAAMGKVSLYSRRKAAESIDPPIAITLIKTALDLGTGRLSALVSTAFSKLAEPKKFKQWAKGTTINVSSGVLSGLSSIIGSALSAGNKALQEHVTWQSNQNEEGAPSGESQVDFFTQQLTALNESTKERRNFLVGVERALLPLNTPELAKMGELILNLLAQAFDHAAANAAEQQAYESTRQWARFVSHASLGSVTPAEAKKKGLSTASDGPTAKMDKALLGSGTPGGILDIEFSADLLHPTTPVRFTGARLFGLSAASVKLLKLDKQPLRSIGLPLRLRSSASSSPVSVTITRDEGGNVAFVDESGAVGMPTPWLSRRGHGRDNAAAYRAARELLQSVESQTLGQLGVELELDDA
ncbi:MAG: hypothetical protein HOV81_05315 [Kofleriaceae bacterium]|nr:hypothetical protein [Kofleriaceae bacterium]